MKDDLIIDGRTVFEQAEDVEPEWNVLTMYHAPYKTPIDHLHHTRIAKFDGSAMTDDEWDAIDATKGFHALTNLLSQTIQMFERHGLKVKILYGDEE